MTRKLLGCMLTALMTAVALAGCGDTSTGSRDFNELIPRMIGAINKSTPEEAAANLFNVTSPDERRDAIAYLETKPWGHAPPYMKAYEILTTDPHAMVRAQAMRALGTSYQAAAGDFLAKGLNDPDVQVRRDAAYALITTWNDSAFPPLILHVKDDLDEQVRGDRARALVHDNSPEAVHVLIEVLGDSDAGVVQNAHASLVAITGQELSYDTKAWLAWYQQTYAAPSGGAGVGPATRSG